MRNIIVHIHIFKNAGTTFDYTLKRNFGNDFVDHREDQDIIKGKIQYLINFLNNNTEIKAFSSHSIHFLLTNNEKFNFLPVYFLRHPIERIKSVYNFEKKQKDINTEGSKKAKELSFNDFVKWYMQDNSPATIRNAQTIFLSGDGPSPGRMDYKFEIAKKNLLSTNTLIGIVNRYDETMVVFEEKLKKYFPNIDLSYIPKNITNKNFNKSLDDKIKEVENELDYDVKQLVYKNNYYDLELFKLANEKLNYEIEKIKNFEKKLENFKNRCMIQELISLFNKKKWQIVIKKTTPYIEKEIDNIHFYLLNANAKTQLGLYKEALKSYEKIIEKFPNNPWAYFYKAELYSVMGDIKKSNELFRKYSKKFQENKRLVSIFKNKIEINLIKNNRRKIFIQANCQGHTIKNIFLNVERLNKKFEIVPIKPVHLWKEEEKQEIFSQVKEADIFLHQPVFEKNFGAFASDNIKKHLKKGAIAISFPNLYFTGYHPSAMYLKNSQNIKIDGPFGYHDQNIIEAYKNNFPIEKVVDFFYDENFYSKDEIEQNINKSLKNLVESCLLYTSPSPRDGLLSRMPSSA
jgi:tetratricopeptide (TPR) repeat protein